MANDDDLVARLREMAVDPWPDSCQRELAAEAADAIEELRRENERLRALVKEWVCHSCNTIFPGPPARGTSCLICPKCGGSTVPRSSAAEVAVLRAENERLERKLAFYTLPDDYEAPH